MSYCLIIKNIRWYYRLIPKEDKKGLFSDYPRNTLKNNLLVRWTYKNKYSNKIALFGLFKSYLDFAIFSLSLKQEDRCFYEIILGEYPQKPHFDVDIDNTKINGKQVVDSLITSIMNNLKKHNIEINLKKDVLIYTSHGKNKQSYHIIINNYCHSNNKEAKNFYDKIITNVPVEYRQWIDRSVYSPTQQFRLIGSQKRNDTRIKTFQKKFSYLDQTITHQYYENPEDKNHAFIIELEESMIGLKLSKCAILPVFESQQKRAKYENTDSDVTVSDATDAMILLASKAGISIENSRFPYKLSDINGPVVSLKRLKPSRCKICNRVHHHENPYLMILGEDRHVYFHCRRSLEDKKLYVGKLGNPECTENIENGKNIVNDWSKNVRERLKRAAQSSKSVNKISKPITQNTQINEKDKKKLISMVIEKNY